MTMIMIMVMTMMMIMVTVIVIMIMVVVIIVMMMMMMMMMSRLHFIVILDDRGQQGALGLRRKSNRSKWGGVGRQQSLHMALPSLLHD